MCIPTVYNYLRLSVDTVESFVFFIIQFILFAELSDIVNRWIKCIIYIISSVIVIIVISVNLPLEENMNHVYVALSPRVNKTMIRHLM